MTMMSKESIEFEQEGEEEIDNEKIEAEYDKLIKHFDKKYNESDLKNDSEVVDPSCANISKDKV